MTTTGTGLAPRTFGAVAIARLRSEEEQRYAAANPRSRALAAAAAASFPGGVPMHWMRDWPLPFPLFVVAARGTCVTDADGHDYADFCLGDTGALFGHSPAPVARAIAEQAERGLTAMLPGTLAPEVGALLVRHFELPRWQLAITASEANRAVIRRARAATGRPVILVFDGCYHGAVDETLVRLEDGRTVHAPGLLGRVVDQTMTTRVVAFNDVSALEAALAPGDVAAVLCEPALTNIGMVLPDPGFHASLRALTRRHGTLLIVDETHTLSSGPGGYCGAHALEPDLLVAGKAIAGGLPCAVFGCTEEVARLTEAAERAAPAGRTGLGTTLSANLLQLAALRANLAEVMTDANHARMAAQSAKLAAALRAMVATHGLPWTVTELGARLELQYGPRAPRTGREAEAIAHRELSQTLQLYLLNRGVVVTPFHMMTICAPETRDEDIVRLTSALDRAIATLRQFDARPPPR
ncbi:MAG: aminotransferase class III-fold pyridoxal phosphate-dependent enzyme [Gammaproteobacteria bacterium]|nr:aminotransferase class III-fold pyridoxal phosphate-dependent enzyme [Gammaproteobacteria bacterium]